MPIVQEVPCSSVAEMVRGVVDIFTVFAPLEPLPSWWLPFTKWAEEQDIDGPGVLARKLEEIEKGASKPEWWALAEKIFRNAPKTKVVKVTTDVTAGDDGDDEGGDDGEGEDDEQGEDDGEDGEGEEDDAPPGGDSVSPGGNGRNRDR